MGLIARALEMNGIPTVVVAWNGGVTRKVSPPRVAITGLSRGIVFGHPDDADQQRRVLAEALNLLALDAPIEPIRLKEE